MENLRVPPVVRETLGAVASEELVMMFADAHKLGVESFERHLDERLGEMNASVDHRLAQMDQSVDRRLRELSESVDHRLKTEIGAFRLEMTRALGDLRFDVLKWNFLFWSTTMTALLGLLLRGR